jgi:hypothetical protein
MKPKVFLQFRATIIDHLTISYCVSAYPEKL